MTADDPTRSPDPDVPPSAAASPQESARERALRLLTRPASPTRVRRFSPFDPAAVLAAARLAHEIHRASAVQSASAGLRLGNPRALEAQRLNEKLAQLERGMERAPPGGSLRAANAEEGLDPDLLKYALALFSVHSDVGRRHVRKPVVWRIFPEKFRAGAPPAQALLGDAMGRTKADKDEARLAWFREDPLLNEHHFHWHVVFPQTGDPNNPVPGTDPVLFFPKDRQGELFYYMHRQMLARYDVERVCLGLKPVQAYADLTKPIEVGYNGHLANFVPRGNGMRPGADYTSGLVGKTVTPEMANAWSDLLLQAAKSGFFDKLGRVEVTPRTLGGALEADADAPDYKPREHQMFPEAGEYGNLHNMGHMLIATAVPDMGGHDRMGVLSDTATAVRDPIFWRWHRHIDDIYDAWLRQRGPQPVDKAEAPPVAFPKPKLPLELPATVLVFRDRIEGAQDPDFDYAAWGREHLAHRRLEWPVDTDTLETTMHRRTLHTYEWHDANAGHRDAKGKHVPPDWRRRPRNLEIEYLDQREFVMFHRIEAKAACVVTLRVFLAMDDATHLNDNRMWIELDRAVATLQPGMNVVARPAWQFSVIRKPCGKPPLDFDTEHLGGAGDDPPASESAETCDCGWPYNLLLPRGTAKGQKFRLFVMATDHAQDAVVGDLVDDCCGSLSFCGSKAKLYPDRREMGYPFQAPFPKGGYKAAFKGLDHVVDRTIAIRWTNPKAPEPAPQARRRPAKGKATRPKGKPVKPKKAAKAKGRKAKPRTRAR